MPGQERLKLNPLIEWDSKSNLLLLPYSYLASFLFDFYRLLNSSMKSLQYRVNKEKDSYMYIILDFSGRKRPSPLRGIEHTGILPTKCVPFNVPCGTPRVHSLSSAFLDLAFCSTLGMGRGFDLLVPPVCLLYDFKELPIQCAGHSLRKGLSAASFLLGSFMPWLRVRVRSSLYEFLVWSSLHQLSSDFFLLLLSLL